MAPLIIAYALLFFLSAESGDVWISVCIGLVAIGALISATFLVQALRRNSQIHVALLVLIFLLIVVAYGAIGLFGGCFALMIGSAVTG